MEVLPIVFPEAAERVMPRLHVPTPGVDPLLRWVSGIERPIAYEVDGGLLGPDALTTMRLSQGQLHDKALQHVRALVPEGFAPRSHPVMLDGGAAALVLLPRLVPEGQTWIAWPTAAGELVVMVEGESWTERELVRLERTRSEADPLRRPVRVRPRGFESVSWPGEDAPAARPLPARDAQTVQGHDFNDAIRAARDEEEP